MIICFMRIQNVSFCRADEVKCRTLSMNINSNLLVNVMHCAAQTLVVVCTCQSAFTRRYIMRMFVITQLGTVITRWSKSSDV